MAIKFRSFILHFSLVLGGIFLALLFAELLITLYYLVRDGKYISPRSRLNAERNAYVEVARAQTPTGTCSYGDSLVVHPYLAFVQTNLGSCGSPYANGRSFIGKDYPDKTIPRTGIILVTGGSVAAQFVWDNRKQESPLERILNAEFTGNQYDRFIVLNGGHGAWRQPIQYVLFGLYADILAGVITLDGYNEHHRLSAKERFESPESNYFQAIERQDARMVTAPLRMAALKVEADLYRFAASHTLFNVSNLAYFLIETARSYLRRASSRGLIPKRGVDEDWLKTSYARMFAFQDDMTAAERKQWALSQYSKYLVLMHAGAEALGIKSMFLIQPIPGIGKPLTDREALFAKKTDKRLYKEMSDRLLALRAKHGLPVYSLLDVYKNESREIYQDAIHVNQLGNELLANEVAKLIETTWGWPRKQNQASKISQGFPK